MKISGFLAASVALLSSLSAAAPIDGKREELYGYNDHLYGASTLGFGKEDKTDGFGKEKREGDIYPAGTRSVTGNGETNGKEKREELTLAAKEKE